MGASGQGSKAVENVALEAELMTLQHEELEPLPTPRAMPLLHMQSMQRITMHQVRRGSSPPPHCCS